MNSQRQLGRILGRPTVFPMPAIAARLAFGEMADELLLSSTRVEPQKLQESGFQFKHGDLESSPFAALWGNKCDRSDKASRKGANERNGRGAPIELSNNECVRLETEKSGTEK